MAAYPNKETAQIVANEKIASIKSVLKEVMNIADEYDLMVEVFNDWDNYLRYYGRVWNADEDYREGGGWYHSTC